jgi:hypothetical protein
VPIESINPSGLLEPQGYAHVEFDVTAVVG